MQNTYTCAMPEGFDYSAVFHASPESFASTNGALGHTAPCPMRNCKCFPAYGHECAAQGVYQLLYQLLLAARTAGALTKKRERGLFSRASEG